MMKQISKLFKLVTMVMAMVAFGSTNVYASSRTYYAKATVTATGSGKVYATKTQNESPSDGDFQESSEATNSTSSTGSSANVVFYLHAQPEKGFKFDGWYTNEECTEGQQTANPYKATVSATSTAAATPTTSNWYAKFVEATEFFSSTLTVSCVGDGGLVAVSAAPGNEEFDAEMSASVLNDVEPVHTYYLQAKAENDDYRFVGWYSDEACETQLSKNANYTYKVTAESLDEAAPSQFVAYAKFEAIPYYYGVVKASAAGPGKVNVSVSDTAGEYEENSEANLKTADKGSQTYYLKAQADNVDEVEFDGWYEDAEFTTLLSLQTAYTYKVTAESLDEQDATAFNVYAKFTPRNMYQVRNGGFEKWAAANEPGFGWNSFPSAVGAQAGLGKGLSPNPEKVEGRNGGSAVRIYSKYAGFMGIGANANGNLTTGTVNMGSTTPADPANHNFTDTESLGHYLIIAGQPDGVEFYTKYKMGTGDAHNGHAQFIIHDKYNYIDPETDDELEHRIGTSGAFIEESEDWVRNYSEFEYDWEVEDAAATTKYLLINITTNNTPGGSVDDELILDDVRLIYNSELASAKVGGEKIKFEDGAANYDGLYDAEALSLTANGRAATIETAYDTKTAVLTITVKGEDIEVNPENMNVYTIQFAKPTYALTFTIDNETIGESIQLHEGDEIKAPEAPAKEGYTFAGWEGIPEAMPAQDLTITGSYKVNSYVLQFIVDENTVVKADSVAYGSEIAAPEAPIKEGYTFVGWSEMPETMPAKDITVIGSFTVNEYNLIFIVDGDTISSTKVAYGESISAIAAPEKEGEKFSGWSAMPETMPAKDLVVTGTFAANSYLLTYMVDDEVYQQLHVGFGSELTAIDAPADKEGYTFSGWDSIPETMPAEDVTIKGTFVANIYKVTYQVGDSIVAQYEVAYGQALPEAPEYKAPESDDRYTYTFSGWKGEELESMPAHDVIYVGVIDIADAINGLEAGEAALIYNLQGSRLQKLQRGINIVNGKKVLVK